MRPIKCAGCGVESVVTTNWQRIYARCYACGAALCVDTDDVYVMTAAPPPVITSEVPEHVKAAVEAEYMRSHPRYGPVQDETARARQELINRLDEMDEDVLRAMFSVDDVSKILVAYEEALEQIERLEQQIEDY